MRALFETRILSFSLATLICVILSCNTLSSPGTATFLPAVPSATPVIPATVTISRPSGPSVTPSPDPTLTATPLPGWVTEFAQPILDAISDRPPSYQDDFGPGSSDWQKDWCRGNLEYIEEELVLTNCRVYRANIDWQDFALEFDLHFIEGTAPSSNFSFHFRDLGNSGHRMNVYSNGDVLIDFADRAEGSYSAWFRGIARPAIQTNHVLVIAKGDRFAFYLNGQPFYYTENDRYRFGRCVYYAENPGPNDQAILALDNFRIWDLSDIPFP